MSTCHCDEVDRQCCRVAAGWNFQRSRWQNQYCTCGPHILRTHCQATGSVQERQYIGRPMAALLTSSADRKNSLVIWCSALLYLAHATSVFLVNWFLTITAAIKNHISSFILLLVHIVLVKRPMHLLTHWSYLSCSWPTFGWGPTNVQPDQMLSLV